MDFSSVELWERAFIDLWSIPHFAFGFIAYYTLKKIGIKNNTSFYVVSIAVIWEFIEIFLNVEEVVTNRYTDVLLAIWALIIIQIANKTNFKKHHRILIWSLVLFTIFSFAGWLAHFIRIS